jgi:hypothetical protein
MESHISAVSEFPSGGHTRCHDQSVIFPILQLWHEGILPAERFGILHRKEGLGDILEVVSEVWP